MIRSHGLNSHLFGAHGRGSPAGQSPRQSEAEKAAIGRGTRWS